LDFDYPALVRIGAGAGYVESAVEDVRRRGHSRQPFMVTQLTSVLDPQMAPPGRHVMSLLAGYATNRPKDPARNESRAELLDAAVGVLETYAPSFAASILHAQVLAPEDLEAELGLPGGHVHHGDMALDQMFLNRPVAGYAAYRSPIPGLYMCGAAT